MADVEIVEVYSAANGSDAHAIANLLQSEGIKASVVGEPLQAVLGELPLGWSTSPRVWVVRTDYERAREIIKKWELERRTSKPSGSSRPWVCPRCGKKVPGEFEVCWNCEDSRPATSI